MARKKKSRKKRYFGMKQTCRDFLKSAEDFGKQVSESGLTMRFSEVLCSNGRAKTIHVMFSDNRGMRVLNYWPGNGRVWEPISGKKGKVDNFWAALDLAQIIAVHSHEYIVATPEEKADLLSS